MKGAEMQRARHVHPQHIQDGEVYCCALDYKLGGVRVAESECGHRLGVVSFHQRIVLLGDCYTTTESEAVELFYNLTPYTAWIGNNCVSSIGYVLVLDRLCLVSSYIYGT